MNTKNPAKILIIDDDELILASLTSYLKRLNIDVCATQSGQQAIEWLKSNPDDYSVIVSDFHMPEMDGIDLTAKVRELHPNAFILLYSGDRSREVLKQGMRAGASDFFEKGNEEDLLKMTQTIEEHHKKYLERTEVITASEVESTNEKAIMSIGLAGRSQSLAKVAKEVLRHRNHNHTVIIIGESGTGKERVAQALHSTGKFVAINCAAYIDESQLMESELFGYERGAFTGADRTKPGLFESVKDGILFLDEVHELPLSAQAKLLRALQERKIRRIGGHEEIPFSARIVAGAKPILEQKKESGGFLLDLYNRLYVLPIYIPPLRERKEDIESLVHHFAESFGLSNGRKVKFLAGTVREMEKYDWPGNVRELENTVLRLIINTQTDFIGPEDFLRELPRSASTPTPTKLSLASLSELKERLEQEERDFIFSALARNDYNLRATSRELKVSHTTLFGKLKKYNLLSKSDIS